MPITIDEADIELEFFRASGPGGQHRNVTMSGVRIRHIPTGIVVQATESRSQTVNRRKALERLGEVLEKRARKRKPRISTKVPRRAIEKRLSDKARAAHNKNLRKKPVD